MTSSTRPSGGNLTPTSGPGPLIVIHSSSTTTGRSADSAPALETGVTIKVDLSSGWHLGATSMTRIMGFIFALWLLIGSTTASRGQTYAAGPYEGGPYDYPTYAYD